MLPKAECRHDLEDIKIHHLQTERTDFVLALDPIGQPQVHHVHLQRCICTFR